MPPARLPCAELATPPGQLSAANERAWAEKAAGDEVRKQLKACEVGREREARLARERLEKMRRTSMGTRRQPNSPHPPPSVHLAARPVAGSAFSAERPPRVPGRASFVRALEEDALASPRGSISSQGSQSPRQAMLPRSVGVAW